MPELTARLAEVTEALAELRAAEGDLERCRERFRETLHAAHAAGAGYALLGRVVGLTRQRVARIIGDE